MFKNITKKIRHWEGSGLISGQQASDLIFYENGRRNFRWMIIQVALSLILLGVVAVFASNWIVFSSGTKIAVEFATIACLACVGYRYHQKERMLHFEWCMGGVFALTLCFLVSLDYWYQTTGEPYWMIGFWTLLTLPVVQFIRAPLLLILWSLTALASLYGVLLDWAGASDVAAVNILLLMPFLLGLFALLGPRHLKNIFALEGGAAFAFILFSLSFTHEIQPHESLWIFLPIVATLGFWLALRRLKALSSRESLAWLGVMGVYAALIIINFGYMHQPGLLMSFVAVGVCILGLINAAYIAHLKRAHQMVKLLLGLGCIRALILYYEALGGLLFTGVGLIITGGIILLGLATTRTGYRWLNQCI